MTDKTLETLISMIGDRSDDPEISLRVDAHGIEAYINIMKWLEYRVELDEELDNSLQAVIDRDNYSSYWRDIETWIAEAGMTEKSSNNSYNYDNALSDDILWIEITSPEGDDYIILQVHLGGDIRGNYSRPHVFQVTDPDYFYMQSDLSLFSKAPDEEYGHGLYSDDAGNNWYDNNTGTSLDLDFRPLDDLYPINLAGASMERDTYAKLMTLAGRDPARQLEQSLELELEAEQTAIALTKDYPDTIFYTDDPEIAYWRGGQLQAGGCSF